jgi:hypothetical protein
MTAIDEVAPLFLQGKTVKREGGFNSQRKIVPMSNNQQSEKRKK